MGQLVKGLSPQDPGPHVVEADNQLLQVSSDFDMHSVA